MPLECHKLEETFLHAYVDGEFAADESAEVRAHLETCEICTRTVQYHQSYKAAMQRANAAAPHALHDHVRDSVVEEAHAGRWARAFRDPRAVGLAAAAVGAAVWFLAGGLRHPL